MRYPAKQAAVEGLTEGQWVKIRYREGGKGSPLHTATGHLTRCGNLLVLKGTTVAWDCEGRMGGPYPGPAPLFSILAVGEPVGVPSGVRREEPAPC